MKILHAIHGFPPEPCGGTEQYVACVAPAQGRRGHDVVVLAGCRQWADPPDLVETTHDGIRVFRYRGLPRDREHWSKFHDPLADALVRELLNALRPDVLHVHQWVGLTSRLVALAAELEIGTVLTLHDMWTVCPRIFRLRGDLSFCQERYDPALCVTCAPETAWDTDAIRQMWLAQRFHDSMDELTAARARVVPSLAHRDILARTSGLAADRFDVLPNPPLRELPRQSPHAFAWVPGRALRIGCWGDLTPHKGQDVLLRALPLLPQVPSWEIHIFGLTIDANYEDKLRRLASGYPVTFHGLYAPEQLADVLLDVAVFPSLAPESFCFALDEALQLGLPLIVSDRGALAERAGAAARVVPAGDPTALAQVLREILVKSSLLADLRAGIPASSTVDLEVHLDRLEAIYARALTAPVPPRSPAPDGLGILRYRQMRDLTAQLERATREQAGTAQALEVATSQLGEATEQLRERTAQLSQWTAQLAALESRLAARESELTRVHRAFAAQVHSRGFKLLTLLRELKSLAHPDAARALAGVIRERGISGVGRSAAATARRLARLARETVVRQVEPDASEPPARLRPPVQPTVWSRPSRGRVLVLAPHPDDETFGCGGTLALHRAQADPVQIVFLTDGSSGDPDRHYSEDGYVALRRAEARDACAVLGVSDLQFWDLSDGTLASVPDLGERLLAAIRAADPVTLYYPSSRETHPDHWAAGVAVERLRQAGFLACAAYAYEVWTAMDPTHLIDITPTLTRKEAAMARYPSQLRYHDYRPKILGLNRFRSMIFRDLRALEAFRLLS